MNDTKYSPCTSETEDLMDGSLRSAVSYIVRLVKSWKLNQLQCVLAIISAVSSLFLLINLNGQMYIWMCALAGLLQLWMCVKKVKIESFAMAFTYSLFSVGSLITAIQQIINYGGYYFSGWRGAERVIVQLVLYAQPSGVNDKEPEKKLNFCPACGTKVIPDAKFCSKCGNKLI